jgi:membrane-bound lytic murein transglycosylase D
MRRLLISVFLLLFLSACAGVNRGPSGMGEKASAVVNDSRGQFSGDFKPGPQFSAELRERIALQLKEMEGKGQDVPVTLNDDVQKSVEYFLTDARKFMIRSLGRSTKYKGMMQGILREKGLPPDLVYMVLIESGFRVDAISPAAAGGPWQFIPATGKRYGLVINEWVDERMDPIKATYAAADYLTDLHDMFGCWYLSAAAYNAGEGKILKALKMYQAKDFWEIAQEDYLRDETKDYVPRFLAAILIAKDPARYGLTEINYEELWAYDEVVVTDPTDLNVISNLVGVNEDTIKDLNPQLKLWCTPLNQKNYRIRVPKGSGDNFYKAYALLPPKERLKLSVHQVKKGETLKSIGGRYGLSAATLARYNGLKSTKLRTGQVIKLPGDAQDYMAKQKTHESQVAARLQQIEKSGNKVTYTVKPGDTPWSIASTFDVNWKDVTAWNNIHDVTKVMAGTKLVLYLEGDKAGTKTAAKKSEGRIVATSSSKDKAVNSAESGLTKKKYTVQEGDSVWKIAARFEMRPEDLRRYNNLKGNRINPGQVLTLVYDKKASANTSEQAETVKAGDTKKVAEGEARKGESTGVKTVAAAPSDAVPTPKTKSSTTGSGGTYTVQKDDTVWKISQKFNCQPKEIQVANGLKDNSIRLGQVLKIPGAANVTKSEGSKSDKATSPVEKKSTKGSASGSDKVRAYKVKNGDTVWKIARLFNVEPAQIRSWNDMEGDHLSPGDVLTIKDKNS